MLYKNILCLRIYEQGEEFTTFINKTRECEIKEICERVLSILGIQIKLVIPKGFTTACRKRHFILSWHEENADQKVGILETKMSSVF